jgi:pantoate--beta-alanine ligase
MVADLLLPLEIVGVETVREADGLAMSSRNRFLSAGERATAPALFTALTHTARALVAGSPVPDAQAAAWETLSRAGFEVDYFALVDGPSLAPAQLAGAGVRLIAAARLGPVRLLDNLAVG